MVSICLFGAAIWWLNRLASSTRKDPACLAREQWIRKESLPLALQYARFLQAEVPLHIGHRTWAIDQVWLARDGAGYGLILVENKIVGRHNDFLPADARGQLTLYKLAVEQGCLIAHDLPNRVIGCYVRIERPAIGSVSYHRIQPANWPKINLESAPAPSSLEAMTMGWQGNFIGQKVIKQDRPIQCSAYNPLPPALSTNAVSKSRR